MNTSPSTTITLYSCPDVDITYANVMDFSSSTYRTQYYNNLPHVTYNNCQYVRRGISVDLPIFFDDAEQYNYMIYDNNEGLGKEYAFITDKEYVNPTMTRFYVKYDVWNSNYSAIKDNVYNSKQLVECTHRKNNELHNCRGIIQNSISASELYDRKIYSYRDNNFVSYYLLSFTCDDTHVNVSGLENKPSFIDCVPYKNFLTIIDGDGNVISPLNHSIAQTREELQDFIRSQYVFNVNIISMDEDIYTYIHNNTPNIFHPSTASIEDVTQPLLIFYIKAPATSLSHDLEYGFFTPEKNQYITLPAYDDYKLYDAPYMLYKIGFADKMYELNSKYIKKDNNGFYYRYYKSVSFDSDNICINLFIVDNTTTKNDVFKISFSSSTLIPKFADTFETFIQNNQAGMITSGLTNVIGSTISGGIIGGPVGIVAGLGTSLIGSMLNYAGKVIDASNMPITYNGSNNMASYLSYGGIGYVIFEIYKMTEAQENNILSGYYRYGYPINSISNIDLHSRRKYNYVKLKDYKCNFVKCIDEKIEFENIMNNGVTIWHHYTGNINEIHYGAYTNNTENFYIE